MLLNEFLRILKRKFILGKTQLISLSVACFELTVSVTVIVSAFSYRGIGLSLHGI